MDKVSWIKELVKSEQQMEESGIVEMSTGFDGERFMVSETVQVMLAIKSEFIDASTQFNELKPSALGRIKIYGIAKTHADFMLFRNGFKMIFSMTAPGQISIRFNFIGGNFVPTQSGVDGSGNARDVMAENLLEARWGAFNEIVWTHQGQTIKIEYLVKYFMTIFIRESAK